jgi:hypothetical protein
LKILVLHSFRQNGSILRRATKKLASDLKPFATLHYANAPLSYSPTGEMHQELLKAFGTLPEVSYQRQWWNASPGNKIYHHLDVSFHYLDQLFKAEGPFDGIIGFSQGGALTGILCAMLAQQRNGNSTELSSNSTISNISFKFAILISGFPSRADAHQHLMKPNSITGIPSLHILGNKDDLVDNERTRSLAACFENSLLIEHSGGHFTPGKWPNAAILDFVIQQQKELYGTETNLDN